MIARPQVKTWTIANAGTTSNALQIDRYTTFAILIPVALTGATCTFTGCDTEDGTYVAIRDSDGNAVSIASNATGSLGLSGAECDALASQFWVKIVSAGAEAAARTIKLMCK